MTLLKTKPRHGITIPTDRGWVCEATGELLVSHRGLKTKLEAEQFQVKKVIMEQEKKPDAPKRGRPKLVREQTNQTLQPSQKIIAEVVEYKLDADQNLIGENNG